TPAPRSASRRPPRASSSRGIPSRATTSGRRARSGSGTWAGRSTSPRLTTSESRSCFTSEPGQAVGTRAQEAPRHTRADQGVPRPGAFQLQACQGGAAQGGHLRVPRPSQQEARLPPPVDRPHQRGRPPGGHVVQPVHARTEGGRGRARPQGARGHGRPRPRDVPTFCRESPGSRGRLGNAESDLSRAPLVCALFVSRDHLSRQRQAQDHPEAPAEELAGEAPAVCGGGEDVVEAGATAAREPEFIVRAGEDVEPELLDAVSTLGSGSRVIGVYAESWSDPAGDLLVYLHGVEDPGNVGTIIRSAHALADATVVLGPG